MNEVKLGLTIMSHKDRKLEMTGPESSKPNKKLITTHSDQCMEDEHNSEIRDTLFTESVGERGSVRHPLEAHNTRYQNYQIERSSFVRSPISQLVCLGAKKDHVL